MKLFILLITLAFLISCQEDTGFKELPGGSSRGLEGQDPAPTPAPSPTPNENTPTPTPCTDNSTAPECISFCELYPQDATCSTTPNCNDDPTQESCQTFCQRFPAHQSCVSYRYCEAYPNAPECKAYCLAHPTDPDCGAALDCFDNPNDPACRLYCEIYPFESICETITPVVPQTAAETFNQNTANNKVDIIWVVDNSGSMADDQQALATNFELFINGFIERDTDYKMGITTTDTTGTGGVFKHNGEFQGNVPVLTSAMDQNSVKQNFMQNVQVGTNGSGRERGLDAATRAIARNTLVTSDNFNFLREDAFLAVIIISDENDQSANSTESYVQSLKNAKADSNKIAVYSIVDTQTQSYFDPYTSPVNFNIWWQTFITPGGSRYMRASEETGGFSQNIFGDYSNSLINISTDIVDLINSFQLANIPIINTIEITVNGVLVSEDSINGWTYHQDTNSIMFNGTAVPAAGAAINVDYLYY